MLYPAEFDRDKAKKFAIRLFPNLLLPLLLPSAESLEKRL